jgi:hypothetical protein
MKKQKVIQLGLALLLVFTALSYGKAQAGSSSNRIYPGLRLVVSVNGLNSPGSTAYAKTGDSIVISGIPTNLNRSYKRKWVWSSTAFSKSCFNNNKTDELTWWSVCRPNKIGSSKVYVEIYQNGRIYRSNTLTVNVSRIYRGGADEGYRTYYQRGEGGENAVFWGGL